MKKEDDTDLKLQAATSRYVTKNKEALKEDNEFLGKNPYTDREILMILPEFWQKRPTKKSCKCKHQE